jgi:hypothetical protein
LLICGGVAFIVEEASAPRPEDVEEEVANVAERLRRGELKVPLGDALEGLDGRALKCCGMIHKRGGISGVLYKLMRWEGQRLQMPMSIANCDDELRRKVLEQLKAVKQER